MYTVLAASAACGTPRPATGDAPAAAVDSAATFDTNASADASAVDVTLPVIPPEYECDVTQPGTVTVHTLNPNIPLLIHDVFGTLVSRTTSDSSANAIVTVPGCGSVTSVQLLAVVPFRIFHTVTYVRDGDVLYIPGPPGMPAQLMGPAHLGIEPPPSGASSYLILGPIESSLVGNQQNDRNLYWTDGVVDSQGHTTFSVHAIDTTGNPDIHTYHLFKDISLADAVQTPLHLTTWSTNTIVHQFHVVFSEPLQVVNFNAAMWEKDFPYGHYAAPASPMATTHDLSVELSDYGDGVAAGADLVGTSTAGGRWRSIGVVVPASTNITLDWSSALLPEITGLAAPPSSSRPEVAWTLSAGTYATPDITLLRSRGAIDWRVALPPGRTSYQLPELPPDLAVDLSSSTFAVSLHETSTYSGYAAARSRFVELTVGGPRYAMGFRWSKSRFGGDDAL